MKDDAPSSTAAWVAAARGLGMLWPENVRLADDPYGVAFARSTTTKLLEKTPIGARLALQPGFGTWVSYMQVRTRVLDDVARAFATAHRDGQVVLLGAGYDCRALRLPELRDHRVFEVDHPRTQQHKQRVLERIHADSPARYLTWDFEAKPMSELPDALAKAGLELGKPVLTIWEGVTMYLTEAAIDASLRAIRTYGRAAGSQLAMTYFAKGRIEKPSLANRVVGAIVRGKGEPFRWGTSPEALRPFLAERGFTVDVDRSMIEAARELLPAHLVALVRDSGSRYAVAHPAPRGESGPSGPASASGAK